MVHIRTLEKRCNIPLRKQCADDYFYGKDAELEKVFGKVENLYAQTVGKLSKSVSVVSAEEMNELRDFALFLHLRNKAFVSKVRRNFEEFESLLESFPENYESINDLETSELARMSIRLHNETRPAIRDLESVVIENVSKREFIASDDPIILTNRFLYNREGKTTSAYLRSAGLTILMPLTPRHLFCAYDKNIYHIPKKNGRVVDIREGEEVDRINEFQHIKASQCVYFARLDEADHVLNESVRLNSFRNECWTKLERFVETSTNPGQFSNTECDRKNTSIGDTGSELISTQLIAPIPSRWFTFLKFRNRKRYIDTKTGMGIIRPHFRNLISSAG